MRLSFPSSIVILLAGVLAACEGASTSTTKDGASGAASTEGSTAAVDIGDTIAQVNGVRVGTKEFEEAAARKTPASGDTLSAEERKEVLDQLIEEKLLYKAALDRGLDRDPKVQKVMVNTLLREVVYANVRNSDFTDEMLQAYYEANKDEFVVPEKVQIRRILIKVTADRTDEAAKAEADRIRGEVVKNPDSFKDLAAQFSEDPYRRRGGDVGFIAATGKPGLDTEVVAKAFTMNVGDISEVFKSADGYNIVMVANKRERVERTFQQMKGSVLRKVKNDKLKELYDAHVATLKTNAKIDIDQARVDAIQISPAKRPMTPGLTPEAGAMPGAEINVDAEGPGAHGDEH